MASRHLHGSAAVAELKHVWLPAWLWQFGRDLHGSAAVAELKLHPVEDSAGRSQAYLHGSAAVAELKQEGEQPPVAYLDHISTAPQPWPN